jgi:hypothetical protein
MENGFWVIKGFERNSQLLYCQKFSFDFFYAHPKRTRNKEMQKLFWMQNWGKVRG